MKTEHKCSEAAMRAADKIIALTGCAYGQEGIARRRTEIAAIIDAELSPERDALIARASDGTVDPINRSYIAKQIESFRDSLNKGETK